MGYKHVVSARVHRHQKGQYRQQPGSILKNSIVATVDQDKRKGKHNMKKLNPVIRGILGAIGGFAVMMAIEYIKSLIENNVFEPDWLSIVILSVVVGLLTVFGPDAAQRKKNRQKLAQKYKK